jgi:hypothetical protein
MDDKRIEDMLRESRQTDMPEGMKDRVMRAARQELAHHSKRFIVPRLRWRPMLAAGALLIVLLTNVADLRLESRLQALTDGAPTHNMTTPLLPGILRQRREMVGLLAQVPVNIYPGGASRGDEPL